MNRYFPEVVEQALGADGRAVVLDGEMIVMVDGVQEFDLLSQRIHPAAVARGAARRGDARRLVAFDLLAEGDEVLMELPYTERRERLAKAGRRAGRADAGDRRPRGRRPVADRGPARA